MAKFRRNTTEKVIEVEEGTPQYTIFSRSKRWTEVTSKKAAEDNKKPEAENKPEAKPVIEKKPLT